MEIIATINNRVIQLIEDKLGTDKEILITTLPFQVILKKIHWMYTNFFDYKKEFNLTLSDDSAEKLTTVSKLISYIKQNV